MNLLPVELTKALESLLQADIERAEPLSGGMVAAAARVTASGRPYFVKWTEGAPPFFYENEAHGLRLLRESGTVRIPDVIGLNTGGGYEVSGYRFEEQAFPLHDLPHSPSTQFLLLEYVAPRPPIDSRLFDERLGRALARMHSHANSPTGPFGLPHDNYLGALPQINSRQDHWPDFYRECRLLPQITIARSKGLMPLEREQLLMKLIARLEEVLEGLESRPALIHGDLWSGNLLTAGDEPVLIDPAVYYGEREMEIAYMELFAGFSPTVFAAYREAYPLQPGYERRRRLHQLYPLLVHLNHFGERYGSDVEGVCRHYLR